MRTQTPEIFYKYRDEITAEMKSVLQEHPSPLYRMMDYHLGWADEQGNPAHSETGKFLRPTLCLLANEALGGDYRQALPAAAAVELLHNFSLIHDDVQDDDPERHHRPTVWAIWGKPQAINAGTAMRILANQALFRLSDRGVSQEKRLEALRRLDLCTLQLIEGQYLDLSFENRLDVSLQDYLEMVQGKTCALIAGSLELGALLGCEQDTASQAFHRFGVQLGLAFQITDDLLGIWGKPDQTGKPSLNDIRRKKKSYPVVYSLENIDGAAQAELMRIYQGETIDDGAAQTVLEILEQAEAQQQAQQAARGYLTQAQEELKDLSLTDWGRQNLEAVTGFLAERTY